MGFRPANNELLSRASCFRAPNGLTDEAVVKLAGERIGQIDKNDRYRAAGPGRAGGFKQAATIRGRAARQNWPQTLRAPVPLIRGQLLGRLEQAQLRLKPKLPIRFGSTKSLSDRKTVLTKHLQEACTPGMDPRCMAGQKSADAGQAVPMRAYQFDSRGSAASGKCLWQLTLGARSRHLQGGKGKRRRTEALQGFIAVVLRKLLPRHP